MQYTSAAYKTEQKQELRNEQYVYVTLGVISKEAQANAVAEGTFADYSNETAIFGNPKLEGYYATVEDNVSKCDGSMFFTPRDKSAIATYQGLVTEKPLDRVTFTFGEYTNLNIKGLTIDFGDYYPTRFIVTNGTYNYEYTNNDRGIWTTEDEFLNTEYLTIIPETMVGGQQRLRILSIAFGFGLYFDNSSLISTSWVSEVAHLSDILPTKTFSFTVDNLSRQFSADNPHSYLSFLQEQQEVTFEYGRRMNDGTIFKMPGGTLSLKSWSSNDTQAKFEAVGYLDYSTGTYRKGKYYPRGISLYDLAVDVCEDAGYTDYEIDPFLKRLITHNPLPIEKHKCLLQLIANASMAILRESRTGVLELRTSFKPDVDSITTNGETEYSQKDNIIENVYTTSYATIETDFTRADGHQFFLPRNLTNLKDIGYVSSAVAGSDGTFLTNPLLTLTFETAWSFYDLTITFTDVYPQEFIIRSYKENVLREEMTVNEDIDFTTYIQHDFLGVDKLTIEFTKANAGQRIHLGHIDFGSGVDYTLDYADMSATPVATRTETIKNLNVAYTKFSLGEDTKELSTVDTLEGLNTVDFSKPCSPNALAYAHITDDTEEYDKVSAVFCYAPPPIEVAKADTIYYVMKNSYLEKYWVAMSGANRVWTGDAEDIYYFKVDELPELMDSSIIYFVRTDTSYIYHAYQKIDGVIKSLGYAVQGSLSFRYDDVYTYSMSFTTSIPHPVVIYGNEYIVSEKLYTEHFADVGVDKTANNVLIDNETHAATELAWLYDYYSNDVEYTIKYRGEPALDPDDLIYIENKFVDKNIIRITDSTITTNTGMSMSCVLHGRRMAYEEGGSITDITLNRVEQPIRSGNCDLDVESNLIPEYQWLNIVEMFK